MMSFERDEPRRPRCAPVLALVEKNGSMWASMMSIASSTSWAPPLDYHPPSRVSQTKKPRRGKRTRLVSICHFRDRHRDAETGQIRLRCENLIGEVALAQNLRSQPSNASGRTGKGRKSVHTPSYSGSLPNCSARVTNLALGFECKVLNSAVRRVFHWFPPSNPNCDRAVRVSRSTRAEEVDARTYPDESVHADWEVQVPISEGVRPCLWKSDAHFRPPMLPRPHR
ncbi:unnamed protein product, partial [Mycena citricolor]